MKPNDSFYKRNEGWILGGIAVLIVLAVWEFIWQMHWISPLFFSGPSAVAVKFKELWVEGTLRSDIVFSGKNFVVGFLSAAAVGILLGILFGWYRWLRLLTNPFVSALYAMPRVAMVPLITLWFGVEMKSKVIVVFLFAVFPILVNTVAGVKALDPDLLRAARAYCATDWQIFKAVALPGSVPFILTGIRQGISLGLIGVVISELSGGSEGVGFMITYGGQSFQTDTLFAGVVIVAFAGIFLTWLAERLERRFSRWKPEH